MQSEQQLLNTKWAIISYIKVRKSYKILMKWWWCLPYTKPTCWDFIVLMKKFPNRNVDPLELSW